MERLHTVAAQLNGEDGLTKSHVIQVNTLDVCRFENGKIVEHWGVPDRFAVMAQLGLLPRSAGEKS
jgi:predicted SnoaL-like aldol condensation-catalyzing enzyme